MSFTQINYTLPIKNRTQMRNDVIALFTSELNGTGTGNNASRYEYIVEQYKNYKITLNRPAILNKGFNFTVNINGVYFKKQTNNTNKKARKHTYPSHSDVIAALTCCKSKNQNYMQIIKPIIDDIFSCKNVILCNSGFTFLDCDNNSHPIEIILLALKWLFIEQDFTYWNYSGRKKLYDELKNKNLV